MEPADAEVVRRHPEWLLRRIPATAAPWYAMHGANPQNIAAQGSAGLVESPPTLGCGPGFIGLIGEIVQRCKRDGSSS